MLIITTSKNKDFRAKQAWEKISTVLLQGSPLKAISLILQDYPSPKTKNLNKKTILQDGLRSIANCSESERRATNIIEADSQRESAVSAEQEYLPSMNRLNFIACNFHKNGVALFIDTGREFFFYFTSFHNFITGINNRIS